MTETPQWDHSKPVHHIQGTEDKEKDFDVKHYLNIKPSPDGGFHVSIEDFGRLNMSDNKGSVDGGEDRDFKRIMYYAYMADVHEDNYQELTTLIINAFADLKFDQPAKMTVIETSMDYMTFDPEVFHKMLLDLSVWGDHRGQDHEVEGWEVDDMFILDLATLPTSNYA